MLDRKPARWTFAWFASALAFLVVALGLAVAVAPEPGDWRTGAGLALVHLFVLGWLSQMMIGALGQFLPVLLARPLPWPRLPPLALALTGPGAAALAAGLGLGLAGPIHAGVTLLGAGFALVLVMTGGVLLPARGWRDGTGGPVLLALAALALVWASGAGMARLRAGAEALVLLPDALPLHIGFGLAGWLGLATVGVSYRLFAMFLIAPDRGGRLRRLTLAAGGAMLAVLGAGLVSGRAMAPVALVCGAVAAGLYLAEVRLIWRGRMRRSPELNMRMSRPALAFLALAAVLAPLAAWRGGALAEAAVFAALVGWLSGMTLAQMIKITSFLTWIQVFAPAIGRRALPQVHELTHEPAGRRALTLWFAGAALGTLALLLAQPLLLRLAFVLLLLAALGVAQELWRIRRLVHISPSARPVSLPPLFLPLDKDPHDAPDGLHP